MADVSTPNDGLGVVGEDEELTMFGVHCKIVGDDELIKLLLAVGPLTPMTKLYAIIDRHLRAFLVDNYEKDFSSYRLKKLQLDGYSFSFIQNYKVLVRTFFVDANINREAGKHIVTAELVPPSKGAKRPREEEEGGQHQHHVQRKSQRALDADPHSQKVSAAPSRRSSFVGSSSSSSSKSNANSVDSTSGRNSVSISSSCSKPSLGNNFPSAHVPRGPALTVSHLPRISVCGTLCLLPGPGKAICEATSAAVAKNVEVRGFALPLNKWILIYCSQKRPKNERPFLPFCVKVGHIEVFRSKDALRTYLCKMNASNRDRETEAKSSSSGVSGSHYSDVPRGEKVGGGPSSRVGVSSSHSATAAALRGETVGGGPSSRVQDSCSSPRSGAPRDETVGGGPSSRVGASGSSPSSSHCRELSRSSSSSHASMCTNGLNCAPLRSHRDSRLLSQRSEGAARTKASRARRFVHTNGVSSTEDGSKSTPLSPSCDGRQLSAKAGRAPRREKSPPILSAVRSNGVSTTPLVSDSTTPLGPNLTSPLNSDSTTSLSSDSNSTTPLSSESNSTTPLSLYDGRLLSAKAECSPRRESVSPSSAAAAAVVRTGVPTDALLRDYCRRTTYLNFFTHVARIVPPDSFPKGQSICYYKKKRLGGGGGGEAPKKRKKTKNPAVLAAERTEEPMAVTGVMKFPKFWKSKLA